MADRTRAAADSQQQPFHIVRFDTTLYSAGNLLSACSSSSKRVFVLAKDEHSARSKFLNEVEDCCGSLSHIDRQGEFGVSKLYFHISREGDEIPFYVDRSSSFLHEATEEECLRALSEWALSRSLDSPCDSFCELGLSTTCCIAEAEGYFTCRLPECIDCFSLTSVLEQHGLYDLETVRLHDSIHERHRRIFCHGRCVRETPSEEAEGAFVSERLEAEAGAKTEEGDYERTRRRNLISSRSVHNRCSRGGPCRSRFLPVPSAPPQ